MFDPKPDPGGDERRSMSVSTLTALIKATLEGSFQNVWVVGEVGRCTRAASGHYYLTLKDENAVLSAVIWRGVAGSLPVAPEEGMEVIVRGSLDVYPPRGSYQLVISRLEPRGVGALQVAFEKLKAKLRDEGLFDPGLKVSLPPLPRRIGIVTSPTGAAVRDIINVIGRRYPCVELFIAPVRVQGEHAAGEIAAALDALNEQRPDLDLVIVGRGGGSLEDLWAFNEEVVARAIRRSRIPVVSAVGHEVDFSIADFVADVRAATPTEAGELVVPDRAELAAGLRQMRRRLGMGLERVATRGRQRVEAAASRHVFRHPETMLGPRAQRLDDLLERLHSCMRHRTDLLGEGLRGTARRLEALSPLRVLDRGYSVTLDEHGEVVRDPSALAEGDTITSRVRRGRIVSRVLGTAPEEPFNPDESGDDKT